MDHEDLEKRVELQSVPVHNLPSGVQDYEKLHFPIDHSQIRNLLGHILTQVEAMSLPEKTEKANKAIYTQMVWRWFDDVMENSVTSSQGCIAPIKLVECSCDGVKSGCHECTVKEPIKVFHFTK